MLCTNCRIENLPDARFCSECGAKLDQSCASCGTTNAPDAKFCRNCGARLTAPASGGFTSPAPATQSPGASRERPRGDI
ncbi:MAG: zinc-ribbon domain-containing protein, partial [Candidatus Binatales bacterium]